MNRRALALAAGVLALAAGCHKSSSGPSFRLAEPSSIAIFWGYSAKHLELHPYGAVANSAQDELVLFDPVEDNVVAARVLIRPLSIPFPVPRPALVASATFQPPDGKPPRPDLLVAVAAGSSELQLIRTWRSDQATQPDPGLVTGGSVDLGGEVVALIATPTIDSTGAVTPDSVRVIAALTDKRLAVVEYRWTPDATKDTNDAGEAVGAAAAASTTPVVQDLKFDALSLAVDAALDGTKAATAPARPVLVNPRFLYAATLDLIPPSNVQGVAEIDMAGDPPWTTIRALDAHTPTRLVAAFTLQERVTGVLGAYEQVTEPTAGNGDHTAFQDTAVRRVYAYRDPGSCGTMKAEECGIAVLDPATADVLEDPWHPGLTPKRYLPPIAVPSMPVAMVPGPPAWNPPTTDVTDESDPAGFHRLMVMTTSPSTRLSTGVLFLPSEDGRSYFADLSRWEVPSDTFVINSIGSWTSVNAYRASDTGFPQIGFYIPKNVSDADATNGATARSTFDPTSQAAFYFELTPGFTPDDLWSVTYQGYLPAFAADRTALIEDAGGGQLRVAVQASTSSQVVNVFDPALGVRVGDIVEIWTVPTGPSAKASCPDTSTTDSAGDQVAPIEGKIVEVAKPDAAHPGGSLVIQQGDCVPIELVASTECNGRTHGPWTDPSDPTYPYNGCWSSLPTGLQQVRIRASGGGDPSDTNLVGKDFVVVGTGTGYAGRATSASAPADPPAFQLSNDDESLACPLIPYPTDLSTFPDCNEDCRRQCERAAIARRARRLHLISVYCYKGSTESQDARNACETYFPAFALPQDSTLPPLGTFEGTPPAGPALAFTLGVQQPATVATTGKALQIVRDAQVVLATQSGHVPVNRYGGGADNGPATGPMGAAYFDRTFDTSWDKQSDRYRFFVPHVGNLLLDASPALNNGQSHVLR